MMRTPVAVSENDKGKQRAGQTSDMPSGSTTQVVYGAQNAGRPATLSPDTARGSDTHARTSRFLRRSRSKQHLKETATRNGDDHDDGLPTKAPDIQDLGGNHDDSVPSPVSFLDTSASPARQPSRSSTFSSPLSTNSGNRQQQAYSPQKSSTIEGGRSVGGWFSSMLSSSQGGTYQSQKNNDDTASIRSFATVATSPSRLLQRKPARDSPNRRSALTYPSNGPEAGHASASANTPAGRPAIAKIGGFDRMFDRAMQFFTDSDSNADRCPDNIWLLGVRHQGWRPEQEHSQFQPSRNPPSARPSIDTINSDSYFHVGGASTLNNLPKPPSSRQMAVSGRRRLSKSSNKTMSSGGAASPPNIELPPSPPRKSAGLFRSRKATSSDSSPTSNFLERTMSGGSSSSSAARSESSSSRFSVTPAVMEEPTGLPSPSDDGSSIFTFNAEHQPVQQTQKPMPVPTSASQTYGWPPAFYHDFYSRIQLTYRSGFVPLPSSTSPGAASSVATAFSSMMTNLNASIGRSISIANLGDTQLASGLSSDAGWGCMLRTGQSLLANALMDVHLGRDFRRPLPQSIEAGQSTFFASTPDYSRYVRLVSWFFDDPSSLSPFSIHKFALEGKKLGKQIGEWFGPSTAAGAIKVLANDFAPANLGVALAIDTTLYGSEVFHIARGDGVHGWNRPVLVLVPLRLGLNGVNPIYFSSLKHYFTLPQCVGIAGGRPSSSYYFVGAQGNQLFYIDPHHTKPSVKSVYVPDHLQQEAQQQPLTKTSMSGLPLSKTQGDSDDLDIFFANAYGPKDLESFHCEKVRKMSLAALDPSMLVGLLCQSKADWDDLCKRMKEFPSSKDHHPIINIVEEMPAWMRKSSRTISGAGLNASTASRKSAGKTFVTPTDTPLNTRKEGQSDMPGGEDIEGGSVEYADSDDWDIDDSDDEDKNDRKSEGSEQEDTIEDASMIIKSPVSPFQEVHPGSFESDEPDYQASRNGKSPIRKTEQLPPAVVVDTPGSTSLTEDFERVSIDARSEAASLFTPESNALDNGPALPAKDTPPAEKSSTILEKHDRDAGWGDVRPPFDVR